MITSSNGNIFRVTGPLCGEFTGPGEFPRQRPVTRSFDVVFDLRLNKRLSKQPWDWWFETPSWSLWRQCNVPRQPEIVCSKHFLLGCGREQIKIYIEFEMWKTIVSTMCLTLHFPYIIFQHIA